MGLLKGLCGSFVTLSPCHAPPPVSYKFHVCIVSPQPHVLTELDIRINIALVSLYTLTYSPKKIVDIIYVYRYIYIYPQFEILLAEGDISNAQSTKSGKSAAREP